MIRDWKEIAGILMRVLEGGGASGFELCVGPRAPRRVDRSLHKILEFAHDRDVRRCDAALDRVMRGALQAYPDRIIAAWDAEFQNGIPDIICLNAAPPRAVV
jgi:hypothetical protein